MYNNYKHVHVHVVCAQCTAPFVPLRVYSISLRVLSPLLNCRAADKKTHCIEHVLSLTMYMYMYNVHILYMCAYGIHVHVHLVCTIYMYTYIYRMYMY